MTVHRFFLPSELLQSEHMVFPPAPSRQIRRVLRLRQGDTVVALDGSGLEYRVRLSRVDDEVTGTIEERWANKCEPSTPLTLYQGVLKAAKFELVLQKCTEIGVLGFVPVITERAVAAEPGAAKQRRFDSIIREAAEQSRRGRLPAVSPATPYQTALDEASDRGSVMLLWEGEITTSLVKAISNIPGKPVSLFVGPEGGFSASEVAEAREAGARVASLGRRILRAETAAIVGSALLLNKLGDLG